MRTADEIRAEIERFNVVAINIQTGARRLLVENHTEQDAEACVKMAIMRRGVDEEFYISEPVGQSPSAAIKGK